MDTTTASADELRTANQGCTELTCPRHGAINAELVRRGEPRRAPDHPTDTTQETNHG